MPIMWVILRQGGGGLTEGMGMEQMDLEGMPGTPGAGDPSSPRLRCPGSGSPQANCGLWSFCTAPLQQMNEWSKATCIHTCIHMCY